MIKIGFNIEEEGYVERYLLYNVDRLRKIKEIRGDVAGKIDNFMYLRYFVQKNGHFKNDVKPWIKMCS